MAPIRPSWKNGGWGARFARTVPAMTPCVGPPADDEHVRSADDRRTPGEAGRRQVTGREVLPFRDVAAVVGHGPVELVVERCAIAAADEVQASVGAEAGGVRSRRRQVARSQGGSPADHLTRRCRLFRCRHAAPWSWARWRRARRRRRRRCPCRRPSRRPADAGALPPATGITIGALGAQAPSLPLASSVVASRRCWWAVRPRPRRRPGSARRRWLRAPRRLAARSGRSAAWRPPPSARPGARRSRRRASGCRPVFVAAPWAS